MNTKMTFTEQELRTLAAHMAAAHDGVLVDWSLDLTDVATLVVNYRVLTFVNSRIQDRFSRCVSAPLCAPAR